MDYQHEPSFAREKVTPILMLISACLLGAGGSYILGMFAQIADDHDMALDPWATLILAHRYWLIVVLLPGIIISIMGLTTRSGAGRLAFTMLSGACLAGAFAIILYAAISILAPLYQYQSL